MSKIAILASGAGSNASKIIEYFNENTACASVDCIFSNQKEAGINEVASRFHVPIFHFDNDDFASGTEVLELLKERAVDWIVLAGFLRKIPLSLIRAYPDRIINLHPSLLPKYGGKGMYGSRVHHAVIENGEKRSGISIHLVNEEFDEGRLLFQESCDLEKNETAISLAKKVQQLEHKCFPKIIEEVIKNEVK